MYLIGHINTSLSWLQYGFSESCVSHITIATISIVEFGDSVQACRMSCQKQTCWPSTEVSRLFNKLSVVCSSLTISHGSVTFHCDQTFYYKNVIKWTVRLLKNYTAYLSSLFVASFSDSCTMPHLWHNKLTP